MKNSLFMFTHDYPMNKGDVAFISSEVNSLCDSFDEVRLLCLAKSDGVMINAPQNCSIEFLEPGGKIKRFLDIIISKVFWSNLGLFYEEIHDLKISGKEKLVNILTAFRFYLRAINICNRVKHINSKDESFSLIYSFWSDAEVLASIMMWPEVPICARAHGYDLYEERTPTLYQPFKKVIDRRASHIFFISQQGKEYYLKKYFTGGACGYTVSYLGTQGYKTTPNLVKIAETFEILSISAVIPLKRVDMIVEALCLVNHKTNIHWTHIGNGEDFNKVKNNAEKKLHGNVSFSLLGHMKHEDVIKYLNQKDFHVLINASTSEGLPVSMMEALSYSIPIIGTDVGGVSEIVDASDGILLSHNASEIEYAHAIDKLCALDQTSYLALRRGAFEKWNQHFNASENYRAFVDKMRSLAKS